MSLVQLNLDANTYSDEQLRQKFRLRPDYTRDDVDASTRRLLETAQTNLGSGDLQMFRQFVNDAKERLMRNKAPEYADDVGALVPTDRQLTMLPTPIVGNPTSASLAPPTPTPQMASVAQSSQSMRAESEVLQNRDSQQELMPTSVPWREMKNRTHRIINIDSMYRQNISTIKTDGSEGVDGVPLLGSNAFNTDFTLDLSEPLSNVLEMKFHAFHIPTTWYNFSRSLGNTAFSLDTDGGNVKFIDDGNYNIRDLCDAINDAAGDSNLLTLTYDETTNRVEISSDQTFTFYKRGGLKADDGSIAGGSVINQNLGWALGFRRAPDDGKICIEGQATAEAPPCVTGPKYFVLSIDEYNQTQQNRGLMLATDDHGPVNAVRPSRMPQTNSTKAQLESQEALLARNTNPNQRITPPQTPNAFATIFLTDISTIRPEPIVKVSTSLRAYSRAYNGPIHIERLRVRLFDDKGNLVNLYDNDWSFSLLVEQLY